MTNKQTARKNYFYCFTDDGKTIEQRNIMKLDSTIKIKKDRGITLSKKQQFVVKLLRFNDISKGFTQTLESLTCAYHKELRKNGLFNSGDFITASDVKKAIEYIYYLDCRLFELYKNNKGNFLIKEIPYQQNLVDFVFVN